MTDPEFSRHPRTRIETFFCVGEEAPHGLGELLDDSPALEEALDIAGHKFEVVVEPLYRRRLVSNGTDEVFDIVHEANITICTETNVVLGVVGDRYTPLQNEEAFRVLEPLLDEGVAHLETGGTPWDRRAAWLQVRFDEEHPVVREVFTDGITPYGLVVNEHGGRRGVVVMNTSVRVVCGETLAQALAERGARKISVAHTSQVLSGTERAARELWKGFFERMAAPSRIVRSS
jgi:phage/plasmid-like protein (TIGR03299 family)